MASPRMNMPVATRRISRRELTWRDFIRLKHQQVSNEDENHRDHRDALGASSSTGSGTSQALRTSLCALCGSIWIGIRHSSFEVDSEFGLRHSDFPNRLV